MKKKKYNGCIGHILIAIFPLVLGVALAVPRLRDNAVNALNILLGDAESINYSPDGWTITVWALIGAWAIVSVATRIRNSNNYKETKQLVIGARDKNVYRNCRSHLANINDSFKVFNQHPQKEELGQILLTSQEILNQILGFASLFFSIPMSHLGANIMLFIPQNANSEELIRKLLKHNSLYKNEKWSESIIGVLYMSEDLREPIPNTHNVQELVIPIYQPPANARDLGIKWSIWDANAPGAPLALFDGSSCIGDTRKRSAYGRFYEIGWYAGYKFFRNVETGTQSIVSFRIPIIDTTKPNKGIEGIGVLNLETSDSFTKEYREHFFDTFYSLIYSSLQRLEPLLQIYLRHLIEDLTKRS